MRTFSEINRDIYKNEKKLGMATNNVERRKYKLLIKELEEEKELVWNTLYEPSKLK